MMQPGQIEAMVVQPLLQWQSELAKSPLLEGLARGSEVLVELCDKANGPLCDRLMAAMKSDAKISVDSRVCNHSPRNDTNGYYHPSQPAQLFSPISTRDSDTTGAGPPNSHWLMYHRAMALDSIPADMTTTNAFWNVALMHTNGSKSEHCRIHCIRLRAMDKILLANSSNARSNGHSSLAVGMEVLISWGAVRRDAFVAAVLDFIEYDPINPTTIASIVFSPITAQGDAKRYRISLHDCDMCLPPHNLPFTNLALFAGFREAANNICNITPPSSLSSSIIQLLSAASTASATCREQVGTFRSVITSKARCTVEVDSATAQASLPCLNASSLEISRLQRALFRIVEDNAEVLFSVILLCEHLRSSLDANDRATDFQYQDIDSIKEGLDGNVDPRGPLITTCLEYFVANIQDVITVSLATPVPPEHCSFRSWAHTVGVLLDARQKSMDLLSLLTIESITSTLANHKPFAAAVASLQEALGYLEETLEGDVVGKVIDATSQFIEVHMLGDVIRQEWDSNNAYRRNQRITPGVLSTFLLVRGFLFDIKLVAPRHTARLIPAVGLGLLNTTTYQIVKLYTALQTSRIRLDQWRIDIGFTVFAAFHTFLSIFPAELPCAPVVDVIAYDPITRLQENGKIKEGNGNCGHEVANSSHATVLEGLKDAVSWSDDFSEDTLARSTALLLNILLLKAMHHIRLTANVEGMLSVLIQLAAGPLTSATSETVDVPLELSRLVPELTRPAHPTFVPYNFFEFNVDAAATAVEYNSMRDFAELGGDGIGSKGSVVSIEDILKWNSTQNLRELLELISRISDGHVRGNNSTSARGEMAIAHLKKWIGKHVSRRFETVPNSEYPSLDESQMNHRELLRGFLSNM